MSKRVSDSTRVTEFAAGITGGAIALLAVFVGWLLGRARPADGTVETLEPIPWDDEPLSLDEAIHIKGNMDEGGEPLPWAEVKAKAEARSA